MMSSFAIKLISINKNIIIIASYRWINKKITLNSILMRLNNGRGNLQRTLLKDWKQFQWIFLLIKGQVCEVLGKREIEMILF